MNRPGIQSATEVDERNVEVNAVDVEDPNNNNNINNNNNSFLDTEVGEEVGCLANHNTINDDRRNDVGLNEDEGAGSQVDKSLKSNSSGVQVNSKGKRIYFFESADQHRRPKKRSFKFRPRGKAHSVSGPSSPSFGERPKKRMRDDGSFNFDLNLLSNEQPSVYMNVVKDKVVEVQVASGTETEQYFQEGVLSPIPDRVEDLAVKDNQEEVSVFEQR
ncbi:hypothetical protein Hanom_Chr00s007679g01738461 [Helianthus anomalus]